MKSTPQHLPPLRQAKGPELCRGAQGMYAATLHLPPAPRHLPRVTLLPLLLASLFACTAHATEYLVATNGNDVASGMGGWANALRTIGAAVAKATRDGDIVTVSNGVYNLTNQITIANGIVVRSFERGLRGAANTVVQRKATAQWHENTMRIFQLTHPGAVLEGLTIRAGTGNGRDFHGMGVNMTGGLVRDCIIRENGHHDNFYGGGVYMTGGTVSNCIIRGNSANSNGSGGGVWASGGQILNCQILDNNAGGGEGNSAGGGGVYAENTSVLIRNCLIARNRTTRADAAGVRGGTIECCTIVSNNVTGANKTGGGTLGSAATHSIVWGNTASGTNLSNYAGGSFTFSCTWPRPGAGEGNTDSDPLFANPAAGDYHLQCEPVKSPCMDAGPNLEWMTTATDLDGKGRIFRDIVDRGAFEFWPDKPLIQNAGVTNLTSKSAMVRGNITWAGAAASTVIVYHGPSDGGTNPQDWANELRLPGLRRAGPFEATIAHSASNRVWCYRLCATNQYGASWSDFTGGLTLSKVDVSVTRRESTEEKPAAFVISRPATAGNGPLDVYFTLSGTGINGRDYDRIDSPVVIPSGAKEIRLIVTPRFNLGDQENKVVELTLATGGYTLGVQKSARILMRAE